MCCMWTCREEHSWPSSTRPEAPKTMRPCKQYNGSLCVTPVRTPEVKVRNTSSVSSCRKRRRDGAVCRNHHIKRMVPCRCRTGTLKTLRNVYGVGSQTVGTTSSSVRLHICRHIYEWNIVACDVKHQWTQHSLCVTRFELFHTKHRTQLPQKGFLCLQIMVPRMTL